MSAILTIAGLTIKEAVRRRLFIASFLIALIFAGVGALHLRIHPTFMMGEDAAGARDNAGKIIAWLGCGMIKFFSSVLAVTLSAGAISAEVEKGLLAVVVPKPLPRASIYLGKWLGNLALLLVSVVVWASLLVLTIWRQTHTFHVHILGGILAACLFPLLFSTLTLCFSSFAGFSLSAGLALIAAGVALAEDTLYILARTMDLPTLESIGNVVGYIVPLGKMNHWITRGLGDAGWDLSAFGPRGGGPVTVATTQADLVYIFVYIIASLAVGLIVFQRRDL